MAFPTEIQDAVRQVSVVFCIDAFQEAQKTAPCLLLNLVRQMTPLLLRLRPTEFLAHVIAINMHDGKEVLVIADLSKLFKLHWEGVALTEVRSF